MLELDGVEPPRDRRALTRFVGFARPYFLALGYSIFLFTVGWLTWRGRAAIVEMCARLGYKHDIREPEQLAALSVEEIVGDGADVTLCALESIDGNVTDRELVVLNSLVKSLAATSIFEFGTFDGRTTRNLAANAPQDARVWTLDLPRSSMGSLTAPIHAHEQRYVEKPESGARYRGTAEERRIMQLYGDSGTYDFSEFLGQMDFVFVDASHAYRYVVNDSLVALRLLRPEGGTIAWHDYGRWDGVTRALNDLKSRRPEFREVVKVQGTTLAVLRTRSQ